jgi:uncharacterized radical SAM superfamily Fe-S cluster-containing enzyme
MSTPVTFEGLNQFTQSAIDAIHNEISSVNGNLLLPTVSLCHHCHSHIPAWRYHRDNKVYIAKRCKMHGISHHMIESDYEFYSGIYYTQDNPKYNFNGGVLIEVTDRCNLTCPHCYHEPDNSLKDQSIDAILSQIENWPLGKDAIERVILSGAEPTLRKDFTELVRKITELNPDITVTVMTNGICFSDLLDFSEYSGTINVTGNITFNNLSYYLSNDLQQKQKIKSRLWSEIKDSSRTWTYWETPLDINSDTLNSFCNDIYYFSTKKVKSLSEKYSTSPSLSIFIST